jgi:prevent-host-death family protein
MKTATIRQVRHDFSTVLGWVEEGEQVEISKHGKVVALLTAPPLRPRPRSKKRTDLAARLKLRNGGRVLAPGVMESILDFNKGNY